MFGRLGFCFGESFTWIIPKTNHFVWSTGLWGQNVNFHNPKCKILNSCLKSLKYHQPSLWSKAVLSRFSSLNVKRNNIYGHWKVHGRKNVQIGWYWPWTLQNYLFKNWHSLLCSPLPRPWLWGSLPWTRQRCHKLSKVSDVVSRNEEMEGTQMCWVVMGENPNLSWKNQQRASHDVKTTVMLNVCVLELGAWSSYIISL